MNQPALTCATSVRRLPRLIPRHRRSFSRSCVPTSARRFARLRAAETTGTVAGEHARRATSTLGLLVRQNLTQALADDLGFAGLQVGGRGFDEAS